MAKRLYLSWSGACALLAFAALTAVSTAARAESPAIASARTAYAELLRQRQGLESQIGVLGGQTDKKGRVPRENRNRIDVLRGQIEALQSRIDDAKAALDDALEAEESAQKRAEKTAKKIDGARREIGILAGQIDELKGSPYDDPIQAKRKRIRKLEGRIEGWKKKYKGLVGEDYAGANGAKASPPAPAEPGKDAAIEPPAPTIPKDLKPVEAKRLSAPSSKTIAPLGDTLAMRLKPECWTNSEQPLEEVLALALDTGRDDIQDGEVQSAAEQVAALIDKMKAAGYERIGKIESVASTSTIPGRTTSNEALQKKRAEAGRNRFNSLLVLAKKFDPMSPNYASSDAQNIPIEQGDAWKAEDAKTLKGKPVSDADLDRRIEELKKYAEAAKGAAGAARYATPITDRETLKRLCKDQYALKYAPFQYVKVLVYGSKFEPGKCGGKAAVQEPKAVVDETALKPADEPAPIGAGDGGKPGANTAGSTEPAPQPPSPPAKP